MVQRTVEGDNWGAENPEAGPCAYFLAYADDGTLLALHEATCPPNAI